MANEVKKSVAPIYSVAVVWLIYGLFLPLYRPLHYVMAALISLVVFTIMKALCPNRAVKPAETPSKQAEPAPRREPLKRTEETPKAPVSPELAALMLERDRAVSEMKRLNDAIEDPGISAQIFRLEDTTKKIIAHVVEHPQKLPQIRKFLNYYLPTTLKLLNAYDRMGSAGVSGENIDGTMGKIETMMDTVVKAFDKQLDALFGDEALDISTDITVMENLMAQEGLTGTQLRSEP